MTTTAYQYLHYSPQQLPSATEQKEMVNFLHRHLEQYGDPKKQIAACLDYAFCTDGSKGGLVVVAQDEAAQLAGVCVINHTHMGGYIPEHILVYIAVADTTRGQGVGKELMLQAIQQLPGDIALHVEPHNPARRLYEKLGFTNKYLEMRLAR